MHVAMLFPLTIPLEFDRMTNAWSLLYDHMNSDEYQALDDAYDAYLDNLNTFEFQTAVELKPEQLKEALKPKPNWKYHEDLTIKEIEDYITRTYSAHYSSKIQTLDLLSMPLVMIRRAVLKWIS
jgi:hypothetical protein